jgi:hypothetical protein
MVQENLKHELAMNVLEHVTLDPAHGLVVIPKVAKR